MLRGLPMATARVVGWPRTTWSGPWHGSRHPQGSQARQRRRLEATAAETSEFVSVVDLTHGRALVRLRGAASPDLLTKVCAVDLTDGATPDGAAFRSSVASLVTDVVRDDTGPTRSYLLHCERSSGQFLADSLLDAGAEFGIGVDQFMPPGI
jgi:heterotetrameric sarcosine oxidase gamma subunit